MSIQPASQTVLIADRSSGERLYIRYSRLVTCLRRRHTKCRHGPPGLSRPGACDRAGDLARQPTGFQQMAALEQGRCVQQAKAVLGHVYAQHVQQPDRRVPCAFDLRIEGRDQLVQLAPRRHAVDFSQDATRQFLLGSLFEVGEALLLGRRGAINVSLLSLSGTLPRTAAEE